MQHTNHLILLAETSEGYHNLIRLVSAGYTEGFYYKPRIDKALLAEHARGLIGLSSCLKGEVAEGLAHQQDRRAMEAAATYRDILGPGNYENDWDLPRLYREAARRLRLDANQHADESLKQLLRGCGTAVEGLAAVRNKLGDAHGKGTGDPVPERLHAELAVNLAGTHHFYCSIHAHFDPATGQIAANPTADHPDEPMEGVVTVSAVTS